jgi:hypothetical protein
MLGFQELLVITLIIAAALFLSRMKADKQPPPRVVFRRRFRLSGKLRLAIAASVIFIVLSAAYFQPWRKDPLDFAFMGIAPVALAWILYWVYLGFKK